MRNSYITSQVSCQKHSRQARQPEETKLPSQNLGEPASVEQRLAPHSRRVAAHEKEDFNVEVPDGSLTLSGERKFEERSMASNILALNVWQASSRAPFSLPDREKRCD